MITLSLCMILRDEEAVLARCLDTVKDVFDEIILADTGSEDGTKKIAADYTDKIYDFYLGRRLFCRQKFCCFQSFQGLLDVAGCR